MSLWVKWSKLAVNGARDKRNHDLRRRRRRLRNQGAERSGVLRSRISASWSS
jgi:hypothetical protein